MNPLSILFAGTPDIAVVALDTLQRRSSERNAAGDYTIAGVLTNPDAPSGRGRRIEPPPVKRWAVDHDLPVLQPARLDAAAREAVRDLAPDLLVVVAYGRIFGPRFLSLFPRGGINMHPSLLPRHRGPSPIQAALLAGDEITGVTVQYLAREMDSGDIIAQREMQIPDDADAGAMHDLLARAGADLLVESVRAIARGEAKARAQDHDAATYCTKIDKADGWIDWNRPAVEIERRVRAYTPWPGARCRWGDLVLQITAARAVSDRDVQRDTTGQHTTGQGAAPVPPGTVVGVDTASGILVQTTDGTLAVRRLKPQSRREMDHRSFVNGNPSIIGSVLE